MNKLIKEWQNSVKSKPPYMFSGDKILLKDKIVKEYFCLYKNYEEYIEAKSFENTKTKFHTGLIPIPYSGYLKGASIFILLTNPGLLPVDYYAEYNIKYFKKLRLQALFQRNGKNTYPFHYLDPQNEWFPGSTFWNRKFSDVLKVIGKERKLDYKEARQFLANKVAALEYLPYHSETLPSLTLKALKNFESAKLIKGYVHDVLLEKAQKDECLIIVTRSNNLWGLKKSKNVIIYNGGECRKASLGLKSKGGQAIIKFLRKKNYL